MEGRFNGGFFALRVGGLILGGAYFRNFTVLRLHRLFRWANMTLLEYRSNYANVRKRNKKGPKLTIVVKKKTLPLFLVVLVTGCTLFVPLPCTAYILLQVYSAEPWKMSLPF